MHVRVTLASVPGMEIRGIGLIGCGPHRAATTRNKRVVRANLLLTSVLSLSMRYAQWTVRCRQYQSCCSSFTSPWHARRGDICRSCPLPASLLPISCLSPACPLPIFRRPSTFPCPASSLPRVDLLATSCPCHADGAMHGQSGGVPSVQEGLQQCIRQIQGQHRWSRHAQQ